MVWGECFSIPWCRFWFYANHTQTANRTFQNLLTSCLFLFKGAPTKKVNVVFPLFVATECTGKEIKDSPGWKYPKDQEVKLM